MTLCGVVQVAFTKEGKPVEGGMCSRNWGTSTLTLERFVAIANVDLKTWTVLQRWAGYMKGWGRQIKGLPSGGPHNVL